MTIIRINHFEAKEALAGELFSFMESVVAIVKSSPGCLSCRLLRSLDHPAQVVVVEEWTSVEAHQQAATVIPREKIAAVLPLLAQPPAGGYYQG